MYFFCLFSAMATFSDCRIFHSQMHCADTPTAQRGRIPRRDVITHSCHRKGCRFREMLCDTTMKLH
jgi:hypothetical protein